MSSIDPLERYKACMILSGVCDALGYRNGKWQLNTNGKDIQREMREKFGQIDSIRIELPQWRVSDDTVLHLAVAQALVEHGDRDPSASLYSRVVKNFKIAVNDLKNRHPSSNTMSAIGRLTENDWSQTYSPVSNDCTAAVRSMAIGLRYPHPNQFEDLMRVSIEISRMTHTHVWGYLGGFTSALFTSFAIQQKSLDTWIPHLLDILPRVQEYIRAQDRSDLTQNMRNWSSFETFWRQFQNELNVDIGDDGEERDAFYRQFSHAGYAGASGTDCVAIAYYALLTCRGSWSDFCMRAALHGGHGDATGCIAGALFGAVYGLQKVPPSNYRNVEYGDELKKVARQLFDLSRTSSKISATQKVKSSSPILTDTTNDQRGPCVHFTFIPAHILDNMPAFRQWLIESRQSKLKLSENQSKISHNENVSTSTTTNVLSKLIFQGYNSNILKDVRQSTSHK